mgnify:CR=1 FL=1|tara:strand:- start:974 stop:1273 length:300 start_codon:yes stop_codon:yes gene_type:complete
MPKKRVLLRLTVKTRELHIQVEELAVQWGKIMEYKLMLHSMEELARMTDKWPIITKQDPLEETKWRRPEVAFNKELAKHKKESSLEYLKSKEVKRPWDK